MKDPMLQGKIELFNGFLRQAQHLSNDGLMQAAYNRFNDMFEHVIDNHFENGEIEFPELTLLK